MKVPQFHLRDLFWLMSMCALGVAIVVNASVAARVVLIFAMIATLAFRRVGPRRDRESISEMGVRAVDSLVVVSGYALLLTLLLAIAGFGVLVVSILVYGLPD